MSSLAAWAKRYAAMGIPVFPLAPGTKRPMLVNGFHGASNDAATVSMWWGDEPEANIGMPTGNPYSVLDVDGAEGHQWAIKAMEMEYFPEVYGWQTTASNREDAPSYHVFIAPQEGRSIKFLPGVDGLGTDGYAVLAPSVIDERGEPNKPWKWGEYKWIQELSNESVGKTENGSQPPTEDIPF